MAHNLSESEIEQEEAAFANVVSTFRAYASCSLSANNRRRKDLYTLPLADRQMLEDLGFVDKLKRVDEAIIANAEFLKSIIADPEIFGMGEGGEEETPDDQRDTLPASAPRSPSPSHPQERDSHLHERHSPSRELHSGEHHGGHHGGRRSHSHEQLPRHHRRGSHDRGHGSDHDHSSHPHERGSHNRRGNGSHSHSHGGRRERRGRYKPNDFDLDKLRSTIKQFVRDWSQEGKAERDSCYEPMKEALLKYFEGASLESRKDIRVLVPGAGLGRLAFDVASLGFTCQGNEFSHYMLLASYFILNKTDEVNKYTIYPYVHSFSNVTSRSDMLRPISIPDVLPTALPPNSGFSLVAGDFEEIYGQSDANPDEPQSGLWSAVLTCFFIDTAKNIVNYLRIIHKILAPGGIWINLGPLLWHFENNNTNDPSIELALEEVKTLARNIGFEISDERTIDTTYTSNARGMLGYVYHAAFWTARKLP